MKFRIEISMRKRRLDERERERERERESGVCVFVCMGVYGCVWVWRCALK